MKAVETKVLDLIKRAPQFIIPIYQRKYSWTQPQCEQLWNDVVRAGRDETINAHFVGSIVYVEKGLYSISSQPPLLVIDGQQRLTTVSLLLAALAETVSENEPVEGCSAKKIFNYYLINNLEEGELHYKLILAEEDKDTLLSLLGAPAPMIKSERVEENYKFFKDQLQRLGDPAIVWKGLHKLIVVDVSLDRDKDNPQLIFESMNSTGLKLTQADLIRNYLLMGLDPQSQTDLYQRYWRPMELGFGQSAYNTLFDGFMRHYLTVKTGEIPRFDEIYAGFKEYAQSNNDVNQGTEALIQDINVYAGHFCAMALLKENSKELREAFADLRRLKVDVAYPLLLELYSDYVEETLTHNELLEIIRLIESYVFRRAACNIPTNSLNKTFTTFFRKIEKTNYLVSVKATFLLLDSYRRFPSDEEFKRELQVRNLYTNRLVNYWPGRLENFKRKEPIQAEEYTVEHILPQNKNLSRAWQQELGENWKEIQEKYIHVLGNLTLTGYNSEYSDRPFIEKRDMEGGFAMSPLRLNKGLGSISKWDEAEILARGERLAENALIVWPSPSLPDEILQHYRPKHEDTSYGIENFNYLEGGTTRELFEILRQEILALDSSVTEEFLKLYIAYKAETNFVDIIPQSKRLRLSLNMEFHDLSDPRGICRDITNIGRWGNGNVEVMFEKLEDLHYIISLIRQSLDRQIGNE